MDYITTPHQAELNAQVIMREWGFADAIATTGGSDGGIDVRSRRALAQVKWKGGATGRPDVQRLYGARGTGDERLFFFAAAGYSDQAIKYADSVGVCLFTYDPVGQIQPIGLHAREFICSGKPSEVAAQPTTDTLFVVILIASAVFIAGGAILLW